MYLLLFDSMLLHDLLRTISTLHPNLRQNVNELKRQKYIRLCNHDCGISELDYVCHPPLRDLFFQRSCLMKKVCINSSIQILNGCFLVHIVLSLVHTMLFYHLTGHLPVSAHLQFIYECDEKHAKHT